MLGNVHRHMRLDWAIKNLKFHERTKTLISVVLGDGLTVQPFEQSWTIWRWFLINLEEYGRANFGVQQLPLFNLLRSEDVDWLACLSWSEGGRWLNIKVPRNLHSHSVVSAMWCREWAYRCHLGIWWIGGWAYRSHLEIFGRRMGL